MYVYSYVHLKEPCKCVSASLSQLKCVVNEIVTGEWIELAMISVGHFCAAANPTHAYCMWQPGLWEAVTEGQ